MRKLSKTDYAVVLRAGFAIFVSLFHLYTAYFGVFEAWRQRSLHVTVFLILSFLFDRNNENIKSNIYKAIGCAITVVIGFYMLINYNDIILREGIPVKWDMIFGILLTLLILESTRRWVGAPMAVLAVIFIIYGMYGYILPGRLASPDFSFSKITGQIFNSTSGIFGIAANVSATNIVMFIIFGAFLERSGASKFFNDVSIALTRKSRGGPAKASVFASALVGMIQGTSVANIATTGTFTIPLMIRTGYSRNFAAAVEAVASTGGMITPPVMGAAAFLLAEITRTSYSKIIFYALIPACLYFLGVFTMVHLRAAKKDLKPVEKDNSVSKKELSWLGATCILPIIVLISSLVMGYSPPLSATLAIAAVVVVWSIRPVNRITILDILKSLENGARKMIAVSIACACAGIIVGFVSLTGIGTKLAIIVSISGGSKDLTLIMGMVVCIILGMGVPVAAAYIVAATTLGGVMLRMGFPMVQGHLFLMYFATLSAITPPVALGAYAAAGIARSSPTKTGFEALKLAIPGFIIPFVFVYNPGLLMMGDVGSILKSISLAVMGILALSIGIEGWMIKRVSVADRALLVISALVVIFFAGKVAAIGLAVLLIVTVKQVIVSKISKKNGVIEEQN